MTANCNLSITINYFCLNGALELIDFLLVLWWLSLSNLRSVINHLNATFKAAVSDSDKQSIDEHMTKFKGHHSCKQYIKNKPIKWGFKWLCRCSSKTGYLFELDLYLRKKEETEFG